MLDEYKDETTAQSLSKTYERFTIVPPGDDDDDKKD